MAEDKKGVQIAVVGQTIGIKVSSADDLSGPSLCEFTCFELSDDSVETTTGIMPKTQWQETLTLRRLAGGTGNERHWGTDWVVGCEGTKTEIPGKTHIIEVTVQKASPAKHVPATNKIRVPGIAVTELTEMKEILIHEFSRQTSINAGVNNWTFDPEPMRRFIQSLSVEQRALLCSYNKETLVAFISLRGNRADHPMCADECAVSGTRKSVLSNADFSVFSCRKRGHSVFLDIHTEYFCFNVRNTANGPNTPKFLNAIYASLTPNTRRPRKLWLVAEPHEHVIYMSVRNGHFAFDEEGTTINVGDSVMGGNYIHGIINTAGCWMLFRNYNWPIERREQFLSIYIRDLRDRGSSWEEIQRKLASLGYDETNENDQRSSSISKWFRWDENYAYNFFFERLVGVNYFAEADPGTYEPNLYNTHGKIQSLSGFTRDEKSFPKARRHPQNSGGFDYHHKPQGAAASDSAWRSANVRGFPTAKGWGRVFADCYIYNPQSLSLSELMASPYVDPPSAVPLPSP